MDTFIDKLAQKRNAQEMIRANMTAEAERMEQLENQMKTYDELMQEIRRVNLKTAENAAEIRNTLKECIERLELLQEAEARAAEARAEEAREAEVRAVELQEAEARAAEARIAELEEAERQAEQAQEAEAQSREQAFARIRELLEEKFRQSDEFLHKENVKVYRNVQAALVEELNKQTEEIKKSQAQSKGSRAVLPISILILLGILADIAIQLFSFKLTF